MTDSKLKNEFSISNSKRATKAEEAINQAAIENETSFSTGVSPSERLIENSAMVPK